MYELPLPPIGKRNRPDGDAALKVLVVHAPGWSPAWSHFVMYLIHLRAIPKVKPAHLQFPEATHEVMVFALDPEKPLPPKDKELTYQLHVLTPYNLMEQFVAPNDEVATRAFIKAAEAVEQRWLCPEPLGIIGAKAEWRKFLERSCS